MGIQIIPLLPGLVPEYECREAAVYVHCTWHDWCYLLDSRERAAAVAHYRMSILVRANIDDASRTASEQDRRRAQRDSER